jgi:hypothetical protein
MKSNAAAKPPLTRWSTNFEKPLNFEIGHKTL